MISGDKVARMQARLTRLFRAEVPDSPELARVRALPRRVWQQDPQLPWLVETMSWYCRKDPDGQETLLPQQAIALAEAHDLGGLFGPLPAGEGKTLLTYLAPLVLESARPMLVVPARLLHSDKTADEFGELSKVWKMHPAWGRLDEHCVSYEKMSREGGSKILEDLRPDFVMFDEAHHVRNPEAAVTRKFVHYFEGEPRTRVMVLTGTSIKRSLLDFAHFMRWALPEVLQPLPLSDRELAAWAAAVDVIKTREKRKPGDPRALYSLCSEEEKRLGRDGVRSAVRRRVQETPGVVATEGNGADAALNITLTAVTGFSKQVEQLARQLAEGVLPDGDPVTDDDLSAQWRHSRTLTSGFWYDRNPKPPEVWLASRRAWKSVVRGVLREHAVGLESEMLVAAAAARGHLPADQCGVYRAWKAVAGLHKERHQPVWVDDTMVEAVARWTKEHVGIVWVSEVALGERLEKKLGLPYYHHLGKDKPGRKIKDARPADGSVVASVLGVNEGNNLQAWSDNLIISLPPTGPVVEQLLARTHRRGQEADEVNCEVYFGCLVEWRCWEQALRDAHAESLLEGKKKLTYATVIRGFNLKDMRGPLWAQV